MYPLQLFLGNYSEKKFRKIENFPNNPSNKPFGGLWTSSLIGERESEWIKFLKCEHYSHHSVRSKTGTIIKPREGIKLYKPERNNPPVDFEILSYDYDAIWWRHGRSLNKFWWAWDVESTLWLHQSFEVIKKIPLVIKISGTASSYVLSGEPEGG